MNRDVARSMLVLALAVPPLAACASVTAKPTPAPSRALPRSGSIVHVQSRHWEDAAVFLVRQATPIPLGIVAGHSSRTFALPLGGGNAELQLRAVTRVSRASFTSPLFILSPGGRVEWVLEGNLLFSSLTVR